MKDDQAPYHAHVYYGADHRSRAEALRVRLRELKESDPQRRLLFVGLMRDRPVGPHPVPQFEVHFRKELLPEVLRVIEASGLTALVHPLTDDDRADHTSLAHWIGKPIELDLTVLDPPGINQGIARFGKTDV